VVGDQDYLRPGHEIQPTHTVVDIGANIGCFAVVAGRAARQGRVFAFEPDRENNELTVRNAALNGLTNVVVERAAVSGTPGTLRLFKGAEYEIFYRTPTEYLRRIEIALEYHATADKTRVARELAGFLVSHGIDIFEFTNFVGFDCGYIRGIRRS
jgi:FkbM family methyltransferase